MRRHVEDLNIHSEYACFTNTFKHIKLVTEKCGSVLVSLIPAPRGTGIFDAIRQFRGQFDGSRSHNSTTSATTMAEQKEKDSCKKDAKHLDICLYSLILLCLYSLIINVFGIAGVVHQSNSWEPSAAIEDVCNKTDA
ncbi:hypothetical protein DINM_001811 [Dirofilaria immitis]|nr:hypothetical protein [Dirofilaria immitis]